MIIDFDAHLFSKHMVMMQKYFLVVIYPYNYRVQLEIVYFSPPPAAECMCAIYFTCRTYWPNW